MNTPFTRYRQMVKEALIANTVNELADDAIFLMSPFARVRYYVHWIKCQFIGRRWFERLRGRL